MRFEFFIAARYLRAKRRQAVVGVITAISVIGVAAGVASLIIALAITNGMRRDLQERLVGSAALEPEASLSSTSSGVHPTLRGETAKDGAPGVSGLGREKPHLSATKPREGSAAGADGAPGSVAGSGVQTVPPIVIGKDLAE